MAHVWSDTRDPLIISISLTETKLTIPVRDTVINEIGELIFDEYHVQ